MMLPPGAIAQGSRGAETDCSSGATPAAEHAALLRCGGALRWGCRLRWGCMFRSSCSHTRWVWICTEVCFACLVNFVHQRLRCLLGCLFSALSRGRFISRSRRGCCRRCGRYRRCSWGRRSRGRGGCLGFRRSRCSCRSRSYRCRWSTLWRSAGSCLCG